MSTSSVKLRLRSRWIAAMLVLGGVAVTVAAPLTIAASKDSGQSISSVLPVAAPVAPLVAVIAVPESSDASAELLHDVAVLDEPAAVSAARNEAVIASATVTAVVEPQVAQIAPSRTLRMEVTAYCACTRCCGSNAQGITASGKRVSYNDGRFVAADTRVLPFRTKLSIPGYHDGVAVEVLDTGSAIKGNKLDVFFPSHQAALEWGRQWVTVTIVE